VVQNTFRITVKRWQIPAARKKVLRKRLLRSAFHAPNADISKGSFSNGVRRLGVS
jgi:hypothetical protein